LAKLLERWGEKETRRQGDDAETIPLSPHLRVAPSVTSPGAIMGTVGYINNVAAGQSSTARGDFDTAIEAGKKVVDLDPSFPRAHEELGLAYLGQRLYPEAAAEFQKAVEVSGRGRRSLGFLGFALAITGKRKEALAILKELQVRYEKHEAIAQDIAVVYTGLGDQDNAFVWLEKVFAIAAASWEESGGN